MLGWPNFANGKLYIFYLSIHLKTFSYVKNKFQKFFEAILVAAASAFIGFITLFFVDDCVAIGNNFNYNLVSVNF